MKVHFHEFINVVDSVHFDTNQDRIYNNNFI